MSFQLLGLDKLKQNMAETRALAVRAAAAALLQEGNLLLTEAKRITPVDLGALRNSGLVGTPEVKGSVVTVEVGFGGPAAPYALAVHEIPPPPQRSPGGRSARHKPPSAWKYLETPAKQRAAGMGQRLATEMARILNRPRTTK